MKGLIPVLVSIILLFLPGCRVKPDSSKIIGDISMNISSGNLTRAISLADSLKKSSNNDLPLFLKSDSLLQIAERIKLDFSVSEDLVKKQIKEKTGYYSDVDKSLWEENGWLEWELIDAEKMYFKRAVSNLILLKQFYEQKEERLQNIAADPQKVARLEHTRKIVTESAGQGHLAVPVNMRITYTITVDPDVVPEGEKIRCWLPWPRENHPRQHSVKLLSTSNPEYRISPDTAIHSTFYIEAIARKGIPTVFEISFVYTSNGQYFDISNIDPFSYNKTSSVFKNFTRDQLPQINFSEHVRKLAESITDANDSPTEIVEKIYLWFKDNIPWTGALEYSIMPDIPGYVCQNRRGDCGMQTLLFISMLRYKGIPVRWQSGWMVPPGDENLHDWCEVWYEGTGWVPVDISYDLQDSRIPALRKFYMSGIDSYRLIVNDGIAGQLHPTKQYLRSEPYDFQRGEVEWSGGNLYFDKWDYKMEIEYLNEQTADLIK